MKSYRQLINCVNGHLIIRELTFCALSSDTSTKYTYTGLPKGICLSPIFQIFMSVLVRSLEESSILYLIYHDDIVIFIIYKHLSIATNFLNNFLNYFNKLDSLYLFVVSENSKVNIFKRNILIKLFNFWIIKIESWRIL